MIRVMTRRNINSSLTNHFFYNIALRYKSFSLFNVFVLRRYTRVHAYLVLDYHSVTGASLMFRRRTYTRMFSFLSSVIILVLVIFVHLFVLLVRILIFSAYIFAKRLPYLLYCIYSSGE